MPTDKKGQFTRNGSILSYSPVFGDKYASLNKSMSTSIVQGSPTEPEDRNPSEDSSIHLEVNTRSEGLDSFTSENSSSSSSSSSDDGESSVLSATSAVVPMGRSPSKSATLSSSPFRQRFSSVAELIMGSASASREVSSPIAVNRQQSNQYKISRSGSQSPQRSYNMKRVLSKSSGVAMVNKATSQQASNYSTPQKTRAQLSPTEMKNQSSTHSPSKAAGKLPSKPSSVPAKSPLWVKKFQLSQESESTLDSQEIYALSMTDGYADRKDMENMEKSAKKNLSRKQPSFDSSASSIDSQEYYAMKMAYGYVSKEDEKKIQIEKERTANAIAEAELARIREKRAEVERAIATEREAAKKEAEEAARAKEAELEAEKEAQKNIAKKLALQKEIEAKTEALEKEAEKAQAKKFKVDQGNEGAEDGSQFDGERSDSDYSSDSGDEGNGKNNENDDEESVADESVQMKDMKDMNIITHNADEKSIKSNMSSVSGSDGDDNDDNDEGLNNSNKPPLPSGTPLMTRKSTMGTKKKVIMFSKGLGRRRKQNKKITSKPVPIPTTRRKTSASRTTTKSMKSSNLRAPKAKVVKKKTSSQMITIRQKDKHGVADIVPTTSADAKVMRVCKLTSKGYISAEFTSVDPRNTPLHIACLTHYPEKFVLEHLMKPDKKKSDDSRSAVYTENSIGELPIHYAVMDRKGVPSALLEALLKEYPESVKHTNADGSLPIHVACEVGAPSLYAISRLCEAWPDSVLVQNDLRVPLVDDDDIVEKKATPSTSFFACFDWFGATDVEEVEEYETGWTPLHLAAMNGAEPEIIETIIETNRECQKVKTNKGRTALECAKWCIINAIINDVAVSKLQNTFAAIQIMQAYEHELKIKDELTQKVGLVIAALENSISYGSLWRRTVEMMPKRKEEIEDRFSQVDRINEGEVGLTNLHRVIISKGPPEEVQAILEVTPDCVNIKSSNNRTPMECAQLIIIKGLLLGKTVSSLMNTFVSLEIMQAYESARPMNDDHFDASKALSRSMAKSIKAQESKFGSQLDNYTYTKKFLEIQASALGPMVDADSDAAVQPHAYYPPVNLSHVNLRITIPIGFRRVRRAFLNTRQDFLAKYVLEQRLGYKNVQILPWNKFKKAIGMPRLTKGEQWEELIGAIRTLQYFIPESDQVGGAHMAYETQELIDYNDFCFAVRSIVKAPDLPYGSEYETHFQLIIHDKGIDNVRMICSSEVKFTGMSLDDRFEVRNSMRFLTTNFFYGLADMLCLHAGE